MQRMERVAQRYRDGEQEEDVSMHWGYWLSVTKQARRRKAWVQRESKKTVAYMPVSYHRELMVNYLRKDDMQRTGRAPPEHV